jgi:SagB-type dehydrogenase family enzyme
MKSFILSVAFLTIASLSCSAGDKDIKLPKHNLSGIKTTVEQTFNLRHSVREFDSREISNQDLSNILWAANGINRADGKRTAPSAMNRQEVDMYVVNKDGIYFYDAKEEALVLKASGDYRNLAAGRQAFAKSAPLHILLSGDLSKLGHGGDAQAKNMCAVDVGIVTENICLFCAAANIGVVPRATMDIAALKTLLKLDDNQMLIMNTTIGYFKSK